MRHMGLALVKSDDDPYGALQRAMALTRQATADNIFKQEFAAPPAPTSVLATPFWPPRTELIID